MAAGRIVFDGAPENLTDAVLRDIYGHAEHETLDEHMTSTSLPVPAMARAVG
jgi:ABC-type phosphate/phosphonate transport system ATPase subunit